MASFKFKLVAYFAVVALLPVLGAYYGFASLAKKHETSHVDNRLRADNRAAVAGYAQQLDAAERRAQEIPIGQAVARLVPGIDPSDTLVAVKDGIVL
ncbi:MAG TPA: hypothetical protein VGL76_02300, partial [Gaiellaceae bacterium]